MSRVAAVTTAVLGAWCVLAGAAHAQTTVRVVETWPAGQDITLARNQNFYLRIAYETDSPVRIWARPYFRGEPANAGSHPSPLRSGSGEALGWFFLQRPGDRVDEIRVSVGDGGTRSTPVVVTHRVRIVGGQEVAAAATEPQWVVALRAQDEAAQREEYERRMSTPASAGDTALFGGFMLAVLALGIFGIVAPLWGAWRWRGGWRVAAMVPAALMAFVVLRIVAGVAIDPTSHNLWPFEIVMAGGISSLVMLVLIVARKLAGAGRGN